MKSAFKYLGITTVFFSIFFFSRLVANAATYYLSPTGDDSRTSVQAQSSATPWFSLNKAWTVIAPGDTVYLSGGTYNFTVQQYLENKNGTASAPIKIWAVPGQKPILTRASNYTNNYYRGGMYFSGNYFHFKGLDISGYYQADNYVWNGLLVMNSSYNTFEQLDVHNNGAGMYIQGNSTGNLVLNSDFHDNYDPNTGGGNADGLDLAYISSGTTNTVRGSRAWNNSDDGFDTFANEGFVLFDGNWSWHNGYIPGTNTNPPSGNGDGFKLHLYSNLPNTIMRKLTNNVAFNNHITGFHQEEGAAKMELYNNIAFNNVEHGFFFNWQDLSHILRNNVSLNNGNLQYHLCNNATAPLYICSNVATTSTNNSYGGATGYGNWTNNASTSDFLSTSTVGVDGPRQSDGSLPNINFMKFAPGSDLIDAGVNVGLPYNGSAPDRGAFESGGTTPPPTGDTTAPTVSLTSPTGGTISGTATLSANASDNVGVTRVDFYYGSTVISSDATSPYSASWNTLSVINGSYSLSAKAYDAANNVGTSNSVTVVVNNVVVNIPPTANAGSDQTITLPTSSVTLSGSGSDSDGTIVSYSWTKVSGGAATIVSASASSTSVTGLVQGTYTFRLTVSDNQGATGFDDVSVIVNPVVSSLFVMGDRVEVYGSKVNVRATPSTSGTNLGNQAVGKLGTIIGGPVSANNYIWWQVNYDNAPDGWSIQNRLRLYVPPAPDTTAPSVPTNLSGTSVSSSQVNLSWNASTDNVGVTGYKIYRNGAQVGTSTTTSYSNTGLTASTTYSFYVSAYDAAGNNSAQTSAISVTTQAATPAPDTIAPSVPTNLSGTSVSSSQINLTWSASTDNVGVTGYRVYRSGTSTGTYTQIGTTTTNSYSDYGLSANTTYYYKVAAYDAAGNASAQSASKSVVTQVAINQAPFANAGSDQTITLPTSSVTLSGSGSDSDGTIVSYSWTKVSGGAATIVSASASSTSVTGLVQGTYTFWLTVIDNQGSTNADAVVVTVDTAPIPTNLINSSSAISDGGFLYRVSQNFGISADSINGNFSTLRVFENGTELVLPHSTHTDVQNTGQGRFSHWIDGTYEALYFSASDNTDPRTNGRTYTYLTNGTAGGGGTNGFSDNFDRANSTNVGSNWVERYGSSNFRINSNKLQLNTNDGEVSSVHTTSGITSANYTVGSTISFPSTTSSIMYAGLSGRRIDYGSTDSQGYMVFVETYDQLLTLYKRVAGTWTRLGQYNISLPAGTYGNIGLSMNESTIKALWNGSPVITVTDNTFTAAGSAGAITGSGFNMTGINWDDLSITP